MKVGVEGFCSVELVDKYNVLVGDSATGKTYLQRFLRDYCKEAGLSFVRIDWGMQESSILEVLSADGKNKVIMFDNADIIMSDVMQKLISESEAIFVICSRNYRNTVLIENPVGVYCLFNEDNVLKSRRLYTR